MVDVPAGLTVYVDATKGTANGQLQNEAAPFQTFTQAINAIGTQEGPWIIQARPGSYVENVTTVAGVNINGSSAATTIIVGTLTVNGGFGATIANVTVTPPANATALIVNGSVDIVDSFFESSFTNPSLGNNASVIINEGASCIPTSVGVFSNSTGSSGSTKSASTNCDLPVGNYLKRRESKTE